MQKVLVQPADGLYNANLWMHNCVFIYVSTFMVLKSSALGLTERLKTSVDQRSPVPLYFQVQSALRREITSGQLKPADRLPPSDQLAAALGTTRVTIDKALAGLAREKLIERHKGRGSFVRGAPRQIAAKDIAGLVMPSHGHLYGDMARTIVGGLSQHEIYCMVTDVTIHLPQPASARQIEKVARLIDNQPRHLVFSCDYRFPYDLLRRFQNQLVVLLLFDGIDPPPGHYILTDHDEVGRLAARHFLALGHRRIAYYHPWFHPDNRTDTNLFACMRQVYRAAGYPDANVTVISDPRQLSETLAGPSRPTAIACCQDSVASTVYDAARVLGMNVPDDLAVIGCNNTPWCEAFSPKLSSVSVEETQLAQLAVRAILADERVGRTMVQPALVVRESCGDACATRTSPEPAAVAPAE